jgi:hypothetical protein
MAKKETIGQKIDEVITSDKMNCCKDKKDYCCKKRKTGSGCGGVYFFGLIASLIYFFQHLGPATAGNIFWAIINSIIWPGILVYKALEFFGM